MEKRSNDVIRIGTVSKIDKENGMAEIIYHDRDDKVSDLLPCFAYHDEYKMPKVGDKVLVVHLSNGQEMGIVMGKYWNEKNKPIDKEDTYRQQFDYDGKAYVKYNEKTGELLIKAPKIKIVADEKLIEIEAPKYNITAKDMQMDIKSNISVAGSVSHQ